MDVCRQLPGGEALGEEQEVPSILIHCLGGIARSPLVLIYWLYRFAFNFQKHDYGEVVAQVCGKQV